MSGYFEYTPLKRRLLGSSLRDVVDYQDQRSLIKFSNIPMVRKYLSRDEAHLMMCSKMNEILDKYYQDFMDYLLVLDDNFTDAANEFMKAEKFYRRNRSVNNNNDYWTMIIRQESDRLRKLMSDWQRFLEGELSMKNMHDIITNLKYHLIERRHVDVYETLLGEDYLDTMEIIHQHLLSAYKAKRNADELRIGATRHQSEGTQWLGSGSDVGDNDPQRNSEADYVAIAIDNFGLLGPKTLSSRDLRDDEFTRRDSLVAKLQQSSWSRVMGFALAGLTLGALIVATDGLLVPFLPILDVALAELITIAGCGLLGAGTSQCVSAYQSSINRPLLR
jgi:hypothetical protein